MKRFALGFSIVQFSRPVSVHDGIRRGVTKTQLPQILRCIVFVEPHLLTDIDRCDRF